MMDSRIVDLLIALVALATFSAALITIMVFVPQFDLIAVLGLGIAMAGYDLFRTFFRGQDRNGD